MRVQTRQSGKLLSSGYLSLERLPDDTDFVSCWSNRNVDTNMVGYTDCFGSRKDDFKNVDLPLLFIF